jgi:hypothetical protein
MRTAKRDGIANYAYFFIGRKRGQGGSAKTEIQSKHPSSVAEISANHLRVPLYGIKYRVERI